MLSIAGLKNNSNEYLAAEQLLDVFKNTIPNEVIGEIVIAPNVTLFGQTVKDIDLLVIGLLDNCRLKLDFTHNGEIREDYVIISSFCTAIELKSHDISGVIREGTDFYVKYGFKQHNVTQQSNQQKFSVMNFFNRVMNSSPFITNLIWFNQVTCNDMTSLVTESGKRIPNNLLPNIFSFKDFIQLLLFQHEPSKFRNVYKFDSNFHNTSIDALKRALDLFTRTKSTMGELTRKRIEEITQKSLFNRDFTNIENRLNIYRGRAGTGKTVGLIQTAMYLSSERDSRVLILTYNKALVADIRRLFAFAEIPDIFSENTISITTMQSYFYDVSKKILFHDNLDGNYYLNNYDDIIYKLVTLIQSDSEVKELVRLICRDDITMNWDYVLIDEAQDWNKLEMELILSIFDKSNVIIADGGHQFVRNIENCDWNAIPERKNHKLKYCLRQKNNIVMFLNQLYEKLGFNNKILSNYQLSGGRVIILSDKTSFFQLCQDELRKLKALGNTSYDMLFLVPPSMVIGDEVKSFKDKNLFEQNNIVIWDGTSDVVRDSYPINLEQVRLLQYDSSRGLEAWTVFCLDFDKFIEYRESVYVSSESNNSIILESEEDRKRKYLNNWINIPLTRAIDTLIITLDDTESAIARILRDLAEENSDYVIWL